MSALDSVPASRGDSDLALTLPLDGVQLIEASAGTGKTYTLAGLYTRLIVERRLSVRQILVVTFTKAATEELKSRLRARLVLCAEVAAGLHDDAPEPSAELRQSRLLVSAALNDETAAALQSRLRLASLELDTAQISTIHGFCQRALREHALFAGAAADGELVGSDRDLIETIAGDLWREHAVAVDTQAFAAFSSVAGGAKRFARLLPRLLDVREHLLPQPLFDSVRSRESLRSSAVALNGFADVWQAHGAQAFTALHAHAQTGNINGTSYPPKKIQLHAENFARAFANAEIPSIDLLKRYTTAALNAKRNKNKPELPPLVFFDAIPAALDTLQQIRNAQRDLGLHLLKSSLASAQQRLDAIKRAARRFSYDDLIRRLHDALRGPQSDDLGKALHEQYPIALVDEFQDTDAQQFAIFDAIYGERGGLFLIGDPKQAIYRFRGGDIHAYLAARERADGEHSLTTNFRSTPAYLRALERLYTFAGAAAFADPRIQFEAVVPGAGAHDDDLLIDRRTAAALTFWLAPDEEESNNKADATERLAHGCAAAILGLLSQARDGRAQLRDTWAGGASGYRPLEPRDLAVLVNTNDEAIAMQSALSALNLPSVTLSKRSVFATDEAHELHLILDALIEFDETRLRAALTTLLFDCTLTDFATLATQPEQWREQLAQFAVLRETWIEHGVLAMLERLFEQHAAHLLALQGGERRMTNWLQLADLAQAASARVIGLRGLADWLKQRIARADNENEDEQLRLESDADRVQIRTVHASKGLEYPLVFLPFAALRRSETHHYPKVLRYHMPDDQAAAYFVTDKEAMEQPAAQAAQESESTEDLAERLRVLYVGLTRARNACFVAAGIFGKAASTPALLHLLHADDHQNTATMLSQRLQELAGSTRPEIIALAPLPEQSAQRWQREKKPALGEARIASRHLRDFRDTYSFSRLSSSARGDAPIGNERAGLDDEQTVAGIATTSSILEIPAALRGARFGTAFHEILEDADFSAWRDWHSATPPVSQRDLIERVLSRYALIDAQANTIEIRQAVTRLIAATLNAPMPFGTRLSDLAPTQLRAEMPFHFAIDNADATRWLQAMHAHGYLRERTRFALDGQRLAGLMTGVLDLVVLHDGRWWVIDYKTNFLGTLDKSGFDESNPYAPLRLALAVAESEYDLQYLIYLVALHRWLKSRLGDAYDYARDIGGALYLFVRGLDASGKNGIHRDCPPRELIEELDDLLAAKAEAVV